MNEREEEWEGGAETEDKAPSPCPKHGADDRHSSSVKRPLNFHDLRRSRASLLADAGVTLTYAQRMMQHSNPRLTQDVYTVADVAALRREFHSLRRGNESGDAFEGVEEWLGPESNREPADYETAALTD